MCLRVLCVGSFVADGEFSARLGLVMISRSRKIPEPASNETKLV